MSGQGSNVNCNPNVAGPNVNTGNNIGSISPVNTDCNFGKQGNNHGNEFNNQGKQLNNQGNRGKQVYNQGNRGHQKSTNIQNNQNNSGKQANNQGTQNNPNITFN